jgi:hypothetical protein
MIWFLDYELNRRLVFANGFRQATLLRFLRPGTPFVPAR